MNKEQKEKYAKEKIMIYMNSFFTKDSGVYETTVKGLTKLTKKELVSLHYMLYTQNGCK